MSECKHLMNPKTCISCSEEPLNTHLLMYDRVAQYILDNPDCKKEIIWLLKKHFNEKALIESYSDVMYNPIKDDEKELERLKKEAIEEKIRDDVQWDYPCNHMDEEDWDYRG